MDLQLAVKDKFRSSCIPIFVRNTFYHNSFVFVSFFFNRFSFLFFVDHY